MSIRVRAHFKVTAPSPPLPTQPKDGPWSVYISVTMFAECKSLRVPGLPLSLMDKVFVARV